MRKIIKTKFKAGFSLVEIMTVLFIVSLGMVSVLTLIVQNIQGQNVNKGALIAYQLSQEGIELVRRTRDSNWLAGQAWNTNLTPGTYLIDYRDLIPRTQTFTGQDFLKQDSYGFYYNSTDAVDPNSSSIFSRKIDLIANPANPNSVFVRSTITWNDHSKSFNYALETTLYDWK